MLRIYLDTKPLTTAHSIRGIGAYTKGLLSALQESEEIELLDSLNDKPDLIHYPYFDLFFHTLPLFPSLPTVVTIHDVIPLEFPEQYQPGIKGRLSLWQQKIALKSAQKVITDSKASQQAIHDHLDLPMAKIVPIYLAANPLLKPASSIEIKAARAKFQLPTQYILYVGDINYNKNIPSLIQSLQHLPSTLSLVCVGKNFKPHPIPEWQWIEESIKDHQLSDRVHFITELAAGAIDDLAALYSGAVAYVQPSLAEGFGLPVLEAMRCQTPVVSTQGGSLAEVGDKAVIFTEAKPQSLATGVKEVLSWKSAERSAKVAKAKEWESHFTWQKTAQETIKVYKEVCQK